MTKSALEGLHNRDKEVIQDLNDTIEFLTECTKDYDKRILYMKKKRKLYNIHRVYSDNEILNAIRIVQGRHLRVKFLALLDKVLDWCAERF